MLCALPMPLALLPASQDRLRLLRALLVPPRDPFLLSTRTIVGVPHTGGQGKTA